MRYILLLGIFMMFCAPKLEAQTSANIAPKPLFRDTIYDGAADPIVRWNKNENKWFMFYTNRRANLKETKGVDWVHGTPIGIAESKDGVNWEYRCDAKINYGGDSITFWAPEVIEHNGTYHMYLTVVPGIFSDWSHPRNIVHLTSKDMIEWNTVGIVPVGANKVIDAGVIRRPDDKWLMFYNNETGGKAIHTAISDDLYTWKDQGRLEGTTRGEGPMAFKWKGRYYMIVDQWEGLGIYSSDDLVRWTKQTERILEAPGTGALDNAMGNHADVVVSGDRAYVFYFTHPGRVKGVKEHARESVIQVAELELKDGIVVCDRNRSVYINLNTK